MIKHSLLIVGLLMCPHAMADELQSLCERFEVKHCPELVYADRNELKGNKGVTSCSKFKATGERVCIRIALYKHAPADALAHEFAHVLQWLNGSPDLDHALLFQQQLKLVR